MALFRSVHRIFRRRLCLLFVLVWIATVLLCGLEVMKFKTTLKKSGLSGLSKTSKDYQFMDRRQHLRYRVGKDSRWFFVSDGFRKDRSKLMIDKDEDGGFDHRIERGNGVQMEAKKANEKNSGGGENLGEYEKELDSAGIKNTGINIDSPDDLEDHKKDEERLQMTAQEEKEQQHRYEEFIEEEATYGEELGEEEFEKELGEEINENKEEEEKQAKQEEQKEEKEEKIQQEQNYETNMRHVQDEKYKKGNGETSEQNEDETEDPDKGVDEHGEKDKQVQLKTQKELNQNDDQGQKDGQEESEVLGEQDDQEKEYYRKLVNQSEGLKNERRRDKQVGEKVITQKYKESMKHYNNKQASILKARSFEIGNDYPEENEGVLSNNMKRKDELTVEDEDQENKGKPSHKYYDLTRQDESEEKKGKPSHEDDDLTVQDEDQRSKGKSNHEHTDLTVQDEEQGNKSKSSHEHDDLTVQDEDQGNKGKSSHEDADLKVQDEDQGNKGNSSHEHEDLTVQDEDQGNKSKSSHEHDDSTVQDEDQENKGKSNHEDADLTVQDEDQGNKGKSSHEHEDFTVQDEEQRNKSKSSHEHDDLTVQDENQENKGKSSHEHDDLAAQDEGQENRGKPNHRLDDLTVQDEDEENKRKSSHEQKERFGALLETVIKPASAVNESRANDKSSADQDVKDSVYLSPLKTVQESVEPHTDRTEGDVKLKEDGYSTEVSEMDKERTTINREAGQENIATKSTELANQWPGETEKKSHSNEKGLQGYKTTKESVENERNVERQGEVHKYGTSVTENIGADEQAKDDEQSTANENGKPRISERIELVDEHSKGDMNYQGGKLNEEEHKQVYEDKRKRNDTGNEVKHQVKNESERSDGTKNGNQSNQEKEGAVEENHATEKWKGGDVERSQAEERPSSKSTSLHWTGQPVVSKREDEHDHQQHGKETGHEQDSFERNKTNSREENARLAQPTTKPTMSEELLLRRQDERKLTIDRFCQKQKRNRKFTGLPNRRNMENVVVIDQAKIIYCAIPKVASTEWREALSVELGHGRIQGKKVQNRTLWKHLNQYSIQNITEKLKKFHKFLFVREPFARLLSAYKSKFMASNEYYFKTYGRKIIQDFRKNATEHAKNTGDDVTFLEFVKYIAVTRFYDEHWRPYDELCHMCSINYDLIGHLETIEEDAPFFLSELGIDDYVTFKSSRRSHTSSELLKYYSQIPASYIKILGKIYFKDFEMFGYPFPGPLKSITGDSI